MTDPPPMIPAEPPRLRHPILLVHGMSGFDQIRLEILKRHPLTIEYFHGIPALLVKAGAPRIAVAALPPHGSIHERALALEAFIAQTLPGERFHIIAHSMGGLDSREYLTHMGGAGRALSLTTLGTPHRGSPIADLALKAFVEPCRRLLGKFNIPRPLRMLHERTAAHRDLQPEACARFNAATPDAPGLAYFSWGGAPPAEAVHWILRVPYEILGQSPAEPGGNDGLVTLGSARWGLWRGALPADHLSLVGWQFMDGARRHFNPLDFYAKLIDDLATVEHNIG